MTITIAHFYYDLLNLYGENGNVKALKMALEKLGVNVRIRFLTIGDVPDFHTYDIIYMGSGTEENQKVALEDLRKYKKEIKEAIKENKVFIITGNAYEMFGKKIVDRDGVSYQGLNIFPYEAKEIPFRIVDETLVKSELISSPILGFQNRGSIIEKLDHPLFSVKEGTGASTNIKDEGYHEYEFYGTYLIGPILVRNPKLLTYLVKHIVKMKKENYKMKKIALPLEEEAYQEFMKRHYPNYLEKNN